MARSIELYVKDARESIDMANKILDRATSEFDIQSLRAAASQAAQASNTLHELIGVFNAQDKS